jgi:hypothetical protein
MDTTLAMADEGSLVRLRGDDKKGYASNLETSLSG